MKISLVKYLESKEWVPSGNLTNPAISSGFLRCGPAYTSIYFGLASISALIIALTPSYIS